MKGLTAKVFRTYNASTLFEQTLLSFNFSEHALEQEKVNAYNAANKAAAELCNHQKAASKSHEANIAKMGLSVSSPRLDSWHLLTAFCSGYLGS